MWHPPPVAKDETKGEEANGDEAREASSEATNTPVAEPRTEHRPGDGEEEGSFVSSAIVIGVALAAAIGFLSLTR